MRGDAEMYVKQMKPAAEDAEDAEEAAAAQWDASSCQTGTSTALVKPVELKSS